MILRELARGFENQKKTQINDLCRVKVFFSEEADMVGNELERDDMFS